jgi:hypothetical protein
MLAPNQVAAAIDGYIVDNTGIATAVQTGAREVVAFLDNHPEDNPTDLFSLFAGGGSGLLTAMNSDMNMHTQKLVFKGGESNDLVGGPLTPLCCNENPGTIEMEVAVCSSAVFSQPAGGSISSMYYSLPTLPIPEGNEKQLVSIRYGTIQVQTMKNDYFGIAGELDVTLRLISVTSKLGLGVLEDFHNYSVLTQEIMNTFLNSSGVIARDVLPAFFNVRK